MSWNQLEDRHNKHINNRETRADLLGQLKMYSFLFFSDLGEEKKGGGGEKKNKEGGETDKNGAKSKEKTDICYYTVLCNASVSIL